MTLINCMGGASEPNPNSILRLTNFHKLKKKFKLCIRTK